MLTLAIVNNRHEYARVFDVYVPVMIAVFVLFAGAIVLLSLRGWLRPRDKVSGRHENNPLELSYAITLVAIAAGLLWLTFTTEHQIDTVSLKQKPSLVVDVIAAKWVWTFQYPGYGITHYSGVYGHQPLVVPSNEEIRFRLVSRDVIHSFWIPEIDFKRDAIAGTTEVVELDFSQRGHFIGHCSQYCGLHHAEMWFPVIVVSPARFKAWAASHGKAPV